MVILHKIAVLLLLIHLSSPSCTGYHDNKPLYCTPPAMTEIISSAAAATVTATSTCGHGGPETVCELGNIHSCDVCDSELTHPPSAMIDGDADTSFWRSQAYGSIPSMNDDGSQQVNISLNLEKAYYIDKISITFVGPKPRSFRILISDDNTNSFKPLQYYSQSCMDTYGIAPSPPPGTGRAGSPWPPTCVSEGTELTPLSGGSVTYTRPAATEGPSDQIIATDIMIILDSMNTLGSERTWNTDNSLNSYSYAISRLTMEGGCFCNGHADTCSMVQSTGMWSCDCQHNTTGRDCQECLPTHNDLEWRPLEQYGDSFACKACDCNGRSSECVYSSETYLSTGNRTGGVCVDCSDNTTGDHCELCAEGYYPVNEDDDDEVLACSECVCDPRGIVGGDGTCETATQIYTSSGSICLCKTNVMGTTCNRCIPNHYNLMTNNTEGCRACDCIEDGSVSDSCDELTGQCVCIQGYYGRNCQPCECHSSGSYGIDCDDEGQCQCRSGVQGGRRCDQCGPGYYSIFDGCLDCGCSSYGSISSVCNDTTGQCDCRPGYSGLDCSVCPDGFHNIDDGIGGCTECPDCYNSISVDYLSVEALLTELILQTNLTLQAVDYDTNLTTFVTLTEASLSQLLQLVRNLTQRELLLEIAVNDTSARLDSKVAHIANFTILVREAFRSSESALMAANDTKIQVDEIFDLQELLRRQLLTLQDSLAEARQYLVGIRALRESLAVIANESSTLSTTQAQTVQSLLLQSNILLDNTTASLDIMCAAVSTENNTAFQLRSTRDGTVTTLDRLTILTNSSLLNALSNSSAVLARSIAVYDSVLSIVIPDYNGDDLLVSARALLVKAAEQGAGIESLSNNTKLLHNIYSLVNVSVHDIMMRIEYLDSTASDLLGRSQVALSVANNSVISSEVVIHEINALLEELQKRLAELQRFLDDYNDLVELVVRAENVSSNAFDVSVNQLQEIQRIANVTRDIDALLQRTLMQLETTIKVLDAANSTVLDTHTNIQVMNASLEIIPSQLEATNASISSLEHRATIDHRKIMDAEGVSNDTKRKADSLEQDLMELENRLEQLSNDINNVTLVSEDRYLSFKNSVNSLETAINLMNEEIERVATELSNLEDQSKVLEQKYSDIRRHLDLLRDIRANIQDLDCSSNVVE